MIKYYYRVYDSGDVMLAIVVGFAFGVIVYFTALWVGTQFGPLYQLVTEPQTEQWLRVLLIGLIVVISGVWLGVLFIVIHISPPLTSAFDHHGFWDMFWLAFHGSRFPSGVAGFALGLLSTAWAVYATNQYAENVGLLGIALAVTATVVVAAGLDNDLRFLSRVNKVSASVFSLELESARNLASKTTAGPPGSVASGWAASEPVSQALTNLKNLGSNAIRRDMVLAHYLSGPGTATRSDIGKQAEKAQEKADTDFVARVAMPFALLRDVVHSMMRDVNPAYFYTEKLELVRFTASLRDLILFDVRTDQPNEVARQNKVKDTVEALVALILHSRKRVCEFHFWDHESIQPEDSKKIVEAARCHDMEGDLRDLAFPSRQEVRGKPYVAIMAALFLLGGGEREAAASILDHWRHQVAPITPLSNYDKKLAALHNLRVTMMMGVVLAEQKNPVLMELATRYQSSAMKQFDAMIGGHPALSDFAKKMRSSKKEASLVAIASDIASGRSITCPDTADVHEDVATFVRGRVELLNNVTYYLTQLPAILQVAGVADTFDKWMNSLNSVRHDCLLRVTKANDAAVKRGVAGIVDTLTHGFLAQATLRRANETRARTALCKAYRSAVVANMLAGQTRQIDLQGHETFLNASLRKNGMGISEYRFKAATVEGLRAAREQVEALGEGACAQLLPNNADAWIDDPE